MKNTQVSVIIPAYNEEKVIERNLKSLLSQSYKEIEIIVVDDASRDKTAFVSIKYTSKVYTRKHAERSVQRNFGASKATGKYLLFLDADMELSENVITQCVQKCESNTRIGALAIPEVPIATSFWEKVKAHERTFYNLDGDAEIDAARFFPKKVFDEVGGYDESITGPEDWDLPEKIKEEGYEVGRITAKLNHYERVPNPFKVAKKKYYYGLKSHRYFSKHNVSLVSAKTIYILRPVFYKNWKLLINKPLLSLAMIFMLFLEQIGGGIGFVVGKVKNL